MRGEKARIRYVRRKCSHLSIACMSQTYTSRHEVAQALSTETEERWKHWLRASGDRTRQVSVPAKKRKRQGIQWQRHGLIRLICAHKTYHTHTLVRTLQSFRRYLLLFLSKSATMLLLLWWLFYFSSLSTITFSLFFRISPKSNRKDSSPAKRMRW